MKIITIKTKTLSTTSTLDEAGMHHTRTNEMTSTNKQTGFSLLELMVVVLIIGIISAIAVYAFTGQSAKAQVAHCEPLLNGARQIIEERIALNGGSAWTDMEGSTEDGFDDFVNAGGTISSEYCALSAITGDGETGSNGGTVTAVMTAKSQLPTETMVYTRTNTLSDDYAGANPWACSGGTLSNDVLPGPCKSD